MQGNKRLATVVCFALLFAIAQPAIAVPNLVVNGSFESGPAPGSFTTLPVGSRALPGWTVVRSDIDYIGSYWQAPEGVRSLDLDGTPGAGGVTQTISTTPRARYILAFDLSGNPACAPTVKGLAVSIGSEVHSYQVDTSHRSLSAMRWTRVALPFTAAARSTVLSFYSLDSPSATCGPAIDAVVVGEMASAPNLGGVWRATYPGGPLRVRIIQLNSHIVATLIDGNSYIPSGKVTIQGYATGTSFPVQQICAFPGYANPHWVSALITIRDANHFSEDVNNCGASRIEWTRAR